LQHKATQSSGRSDGQTKATLGREGRIACMVSQRLTTVSRWSGITSSNLDDQLDWVSAGLGP